jgi:hypothetical protein
MMKALFILCCLWWLLGGSFHALSATTQIKADLSQPLGSDCTVTTPATPPLLLRTANGSSQLWRFGLVQGALRGWPQTATSQDGTSTAGVLHSAKSESPSGLTPLNQVVPKMAGPQIATQLLSWLPLNTDAAQGESRLLFGWYNPLTQRQQIAITQGMAAPELLWQSPMFPAHGDPELPWAAPTLSYYRHQGQLMPVVLHNADPTSRSRVQLQHALTGQSIVSWPLQLTATNAQTEPWLQLAPLVAAPVTLDRNLDASLDRIYLLDQAGRLLRLDLASGAANAEVQWVADFSDSGWQFNFAPQASRALLVAGWQAQAPSAASPPPTSIATTSTGTAFSQMGQQAGDVLLFIAKQQEQYKLLVLTMPDQPAAAPLRWRELRDLSSTITASGAAEAASSTTLATSTRGGWWTALPAIPMHKPSLLAGVIYQPLTSSEVECAKASVMSQLLALHLYQGTAVYPQSLLTTTGITEPWLEPVLLPDERLGLAAMADGAVILRGLRGISPQCPTCTALLSPQQFPIWHRVSSFQHEDGAY